MITNGDFQLKNCTSVEGFCIWNKATFVKTDVPGWLPHPIIEVGRANLFNTNWPSESTNFVSKLDPSRNTCIKQKIILKKGTYKLSFNWAAEKNKPFDTSKVIVKVNGQIITL